jgi:hypothetical protein
MVGDPMLRDWMLRDPMTRFSAQSHEGSRNTPNRPPYVALCGETPERGEAADD